MGKLKATVCIQSSGTCQIYQATFVKCWIKLFTIWVILAAYGSDRSFWAGGTKIDGQWKWTNNETIRMFSSGQPVDASHVYTILNHVASFKLASSPQASLYALCEGKLPSYIRYFRTERNPFTWCCWSSSTGIFIIYKWLNKKVLCDCLPNYLRVPWNFEVCQKNQIESNMFFFFCSWRVR